MTLDDTPKMSLKEFKELVSKANTGELPFHRREPKLTKRLGLRQFTIDDVFWIMRKGKHIQPFWDPDWNSFTAHMNGKTLNGRSAKIKLAIPLDRSRITAISIWDPTEPRRSR